MGILKDAQTQFNVHALDNQFALYIYNTNLIILFTGILTKSNWLAILIAHTLVIFKKVQLLTSLANLNLIPWAID